MELPIETQNQWGRGAWEMLVDERTDWGEPRKCLEMKQQTGLVLG